MPTPALVLLSGGQDSATCLAIAAENHHPLITLTIDYGQRHDIELASAEKLSNLAGADWSQINMNFLAEINQNSLTNPSLAIEEKEGALPSTFVPGRNHMFLSMAALYAYKYKVNHIYTGVCQTDYSGYPDCREDFITSLNTTLNLAMETHMKIQTPLMHLTKAQTVLKMKELDRLDWLIHTHTCYEGTSPACAVCPACKLRLNGFKEAGIPDPIPYETTN